MFSYSEAEGGDRVSKYFILLFYFAKELQLLKIYDLQFTFNQLQNVHQYVRQHETCVLEPFSPSAELSEVFNQTETVSSSNQSENFTNILSRKRHYEW